MKYIRILIPILLLTLSFAACKEKDVISVPTTTTPQATTPPETIPPETEPIEDVVPTIENTYSVSLPITTDTFQTENGTLLFSYSYQTMYTDMPDRDVEDKIIMDFTERIEKTRIESAAVLADAEMAYANNPAFSAFSYEIQYDIMRIDQGVMSLFGHIVQISDSSPMNRHLIAANYNMVTGDMLTIGSILYHEDTKDDLAALVIAQLEAREDITLYDEYRETVAARFYRDESTDEDFYFSNTGLCFYFAPYEIAPRSAGTVIVEIPYNKLTGIIGDEYFPAERTYTKGSMQIIPFDNADQDGYRYFYDVIATPDATKLLLTTESAVQDIRIYELIWAKDGMSYTQKRNIYATNFLHRDDAILFEANFDDFRPNYLITYSIDGMTYAFYMNKDSQTQTISLTSVHQFN